MHIQIDLPISWVILNKNACVIHRNLS
jgi:hypothetical protein